MKILLTGGSGMVGRNLLAHAGAARHQFLAPTHEELDLFRPEAVAAFLQEHRPELVLHCAGRVGGIEANRSANGAFLAENALMGLNLLRAAQQAGIPKFLNLASSCMYPKDREHPLRVEDLLTGPLEASNEGYALAKLLTTRLAHFISAETGAQYKTLIPCNLYGPWDTFDTLNGHLISSIIRKVHQAKAAGDTAIEIWGDGSARREFMHVSDLVEMILLGVDRLEDLPTTINVGAGEDHRVLDYYRLACEVIGLEPRFRFDLSRPTGMKRKLMDSTNARALGWQPGVSLREGIAMTYQHFLEHQA